MLWRRYAQIVTLMSIGTERQGLIEITESDRELGGRSGGEGWAADYILPSYVGIPTHSRKRRGGRAQRS